MGWDFDLVGSSVTCLCGGGNCHPLRVRVNQGGKIAHVGPRETTHEKGKPSGRGTSIAIEFSCEDCPRTFFVAFQFHKGVTYTGRAPGIPDVRAVAEEGLPTLWRD